MGASVIFKNLNIDGAIKDVICEDGVIAFVGKTSFDGIDFHGKEVYPGLVDIHTHGMGGIDTMDGNITELAKLYAKNGTTSFLPTTMTADFESVKKVLSAETKAVCGADVLGFHLEGPYINEECAGAQNSAFVRKPDIEEIKEFDNVSMVTIAPEVEGAMDFIANSNVVISLGHTGADYDIGLKAAKAGAKCLTHTYNVMNPIHHREPGLIGAAFDSDMYVQIICDGIHIHPSVVRMTYKMFGPDRMILISDSMRATGLPNGKYDLGGQKIKVKKGVARTKNKALAGSTTTLFECVKRAIEFGIPKKDAFTMASETPAELLGVKKGRIEEGYDCDFLVLNDDEELDNIIVNGVII